MNLLDSLLDAIVRLEGDALVMHVGEKPYVVTTSASMNAYRGPLAWGQVELSSRVLTPDAVLGMLGQILPLDQRQALEEYGAVEYDVPAADDAPERFTVVAARGGDDVWLEVRRQPKASEIAEQVEVVEEPASTSTEAPMPAEAAIAAPAIAASPEPQLEIIEEPADEQEVEEEEEVFEISLDEHAVPAVAAPAIPEAAPVAEAPPETPPLEIVEEELQLHPTEAEVDEMLAATAAALLTGTATPPSAVQVAISEPPADVEIAQDAASAQESASVEEIATVQEFASAEEIPAPEETIRSEEIPSVEAIGAAEEMPTAEIVELPEIPVEAVADVPAIEAEIDARAAEPIEEVPEVVAEIPEPVAEIPEPIAIPEPVAEIPEPIAEIPEPVSEIPEPVSEIPEPVAEIPEPVVAEVAQPVAEIPEPVAEIPEPVAEIPEPVAEVIEPIAERIEDVAPVAVEPPPASQPEPVIAATPQPPMPELAPEPIVDARPAAVVLPISRAPRQEPTETRTPEIRSATGAPIERVLRIAAARGASTVYVVAQSPPMIRVEGEISLLEGEPVATPADIERLIMDLAPAPARESGGAPAEWLTDVPDAGRVRCMTFRDHRGPGVIFRMIPPKAISAEQLGLSTEVQALCSQPDGLVIVAGARATGKSTLLAAFVELINRTRSDHVITIEPQIGYVHESRRSFVSQREIRPEHMVSAVRSALREDPDVLVIEEMRTPEVAMMALDAAETGRLVFGSLPAATAPGAIDRFLELFPADRRAQAQASMAGALRGVVSQVLLRKIRGGRVAAREVLLNTPAVANLIAEGRTFQLPVALDSGRRHGMMPLVDSLAALVRDGTVHAAEAYRKAPDRDALLALLRHHGIDTSFAERLA